MSQREKGTVKWFNPTKGFGFISREGSSDVFVHKNAISGRTLNEGDRVEFSVQESPRGLMAVNVTAI